MRERGSGTRRVVEMPAEGGIPAKQLNLAMEIDSTEGIITAVEAGLGIGFASLWSISKALQLGPFELCHPRMRIKRPLRVVYPLGHDPQGLPGFLQFLRSRNDVTIRYGQSPADRAFVEFSEKLILFTSNHRLLRIPNHKRRA